MLHLPDDRSPERDTAMERFSPSREIDVDRLRG